MIVPPLAGLAVIYGRYVRSISKQTQDALAQATQVKTCALFIWASACTSTFHIFNMSAVHLHSTYL